MRFEPVAVAGAFIVHLDAHVDERGSFARTFCEDEFARVGIAMRVVQANLSRNRSRHTLRGLHTQSPGHAEPKLVQCVRGRIFDVAVDLRPDSSTRGCHCTVELDADGDRLLYIPPGCAHGFLTLAEDSEVLYYMGERFVPGVGIGVRWDDPRFGIVWPAPPQFISERDAGYPDYAGFSDGRE